MNLLKTGGLQAHLNTLTKFLEHLTSFTLYQPERYICIYFLCDETNLQPFPPGFQKNSLERILLLLVFGWDKLKAIVNRVKLLVHRLLSYCLFKCNMVKVFCSPKFPVQGFTKRRIQKTTCCRQGRRFTKPALTLDHVLGTPNRLTGRL